MKLLFAHGWGFDRRFWAPLAALLPQYPHVIDDRGYFGAPHDPPIEGACVAVTHSFGTMRILSAPPPGLAGIVAINGFERFSALPGRPGVPPRVLDRMLRRFETDPRGVLTEFHRACGSDVVFDRIRTAPLRADLIRLRDGAAPPPAVPVMSVQGGADPLLPPDMRAAAFASANVRRVDHVGGGHLLPVEAPDVCASAVRALLEST